MEGVDSSSDLKHSACLHYLHFGKMCRKLIALCKSKALSIDQQFGYSRKICTQQSSPPLVQSETKTRTPISIVITGISTLWEWNLHITTTMVNEVGHVKGPKFTSESGKGTTLDICT